MVDPKVQRDQTREFCRHLVNFAWFDRPLDKNGQPKNEQRFFGFSGFLMSFRGIWCLVTAGHILQDLDKIVADGTVKPNGCYLADVWGSGAECREPIPFVYEDADRFYIVDDEDGLDFGLIALRPYYSRQLAANGVRVISEHNWIHQHRIEFTEYALLGFPKTDWGVVTKQDEQTIETVAKPVPVYVPIKKVDPSPYPKTTYPRLVGHIDPKVPIEDIDGMSGGPIFGFGESSEGGRAYWLAAVQSGWLPESRIIFGCPVPVFAGLIEDMLKEMETESPTESSN